MISRIEMHINRCFPKLPIDLDRYHAVANYADKSTLLGVSVMIGDMLRRQAQDHLRRRYTIRVFNADFGKLARTISVKDFQDPVFTQLRVWFPEQ